MTAAAPLSSDTLHAPDSRAWTLVGVLGAALAASGLSDVPLLAVPLWAAALLLTGQRLRFLRWSIGGSGLLALGVLLATLPVLFASAPPAEAMLDGLWRAGGLLLGGAVARGAWTLSRGRSAWGLALAAGAALLFPAALTLPGLLLLALSHGHHRQRGPYRLRGRALPLTVGASALAVGLLVAFALPLLPDKARQWEPAQFQAFPAEGTGTGTHAGADCWLGEALYQALRRRDGCTVHGQPAVSQEGPLLWGGAWMQGVADRLSSPFELILGRAGRSSATGGSGSPGGNASGEQELSVRAEEGVVTAEEPVAEAATPASDLLSPWWGLLALLALGAAVARGKRVRSQTAGIAQPVAPPVPPAPEPAERVRRAYRRVLDRASETGLGRGPTETPQEWAARLADAHPELAPLRALTRRYAGVRYGLTPDARVADEAEAEAMALLRTLAVRSNEGHPTTALG